MFDFGEYAGDTLAKHEDDYCEVPLMKTLHMFGGEKFDKLYVSVSLVDQCSMGFHDITGIFLFLSSFSSCAFKNGYCALVDDVKTYKVFQSPLITITW